MVIGKGLVVIDKI